MYVTQHGSITDRTAVDQLYALYLESYGEMPYTDISREVHLRSEFDAIIGDPSCRTTVVRDDDGSPVAMSTFATEIGVDHFLSRQFFQRHFPDRLADGRVHYVAWIVVHPDFKGLRATWDLARSALAAEAEEGALLVFDLPMTNQRHESGGGAEFFHRVASTVSEVELKVFGATRFYALDFAGAEQQIESEAEPSTTRDATTDVATGAVRA